MKYLYGGKIYDEVQHWWISTERGLIGPDGRHVFECELKAAQDLIQPQYVNYKPTPDLLTCSKELKQRGFNIPIYPNNQYMVLAAFLIDPCLEVPCFISCTKE